MINQKKKTFWTLLIAVIIGIVTIACNEASDHPETFDQWTIAYLTRTDTNILQTPGIQVINAGSGSPMFGENRAKPSVAVIAGGKFLLFDVGDGTTSSLDTLNMPIAQVKNIFLTHYHSDHTGDLGQFINNTWTQPPFRQEPITIHGPTGCDDFVAGINAASQADIDIRSANTGAPSAGGLGVSNEFVYPEDGSAMEVWSEDGVVVKVFKNDHYDVEISCGYRIEYAGRSVVISGDTIKNVDVVNNAVGSDLLFHEASSYAMTNRAAAIIEMAIPAPEGPFMAERLRSTTEHHSDTLDAAEVASEAGVGRLVLTHIQPPIPAHLNPLFTAGMSNIYSGPIDVGQDNDFYYLPPESNDIIGPCNGEPCTP